MSEGPQKKHPKENPDISQLKGQIEELTSALLRERADATNIRRRAEEDRLKMASYFKATVVKDLLPFIDNFDRALLLAPKTSDKNVSDWFGGLKTIEKQLWQSLESLGVKRIKTLNETFDPKYHEAVQMDSSGQGTNEVITEEVMSGYTMDGEVLRHAMVKVSMK